MAILLQQDLLFRGLETVELTCPVAEESAQQLLGDLLLLDIAPFDTFLESREDLALSAMLPQGSMHRTYVSESIRLREDAGGRAALDLLGADVVGCDVSSMISFEAGRDKTCWRRENRKIGVLTSTVSPQEELAVAVDDGVQQCFPVLGSLG